MKKLLAVFGGLFLLCVVLCIGFGSYIGAGIEAGTRPDSRVLTGSELKQPTRDAIMGIVELRPGEEIRYFYSDAISSFKADGNLITDQRVISWFEEEDGSVTVLDADYAAIDDASVHYSESMLENSELLVATRDGSEFGVWFSSEDGRDRPAIEFVLEQISDNEPDGDAGNP